MAEVTVTRGVVLRETQTKETDKVLTLLSEDLGKMTVIARGARRKTCKFAACAQSLAYSEWTLYQRGSWWYAREGSTLELFDGLRTDLGNACAGILHGRADGGRFTGRSSGPGASAPPAERLICPVQPAQVRSVGETGF